VNSEIGVEPMIQAIQQRKKPFSSFTYKEAFKYLGVNELQRWHIEAAPVPISDFFKQRLERLQRFDLESLKVWKGAYLEGETVCGNADYLIAERRAYLEAPFVCVIEAKKDDFEQGAAQCLVEMKTCQWVNQQLGKRVDVYGIVTNGEGWKFYRMTVDGMVSESLLYGIGEMSILLGLLRSVFQQCEKNLGNL
jgi:hypothetical protein